MPQGIPLQVWIPVLVAVYIVWRVLRRYWRKCLCCLGARCCLGCGVYSKPDTDASWLCLRVRYGTKAASIRLTQVAQEDNAVFFRSAPRCVIKGVSLGLCPCCDPEVSLRWLGRDYITDTNQGLRVPLPSRVRIPRHLRAVVAGYAARPTHDSSFIMMSPHRAVTINWEPETALGPQDDPDVALQRIVTHC